MIQIKEIHAWPAFMNLTTYATKAFEELPGNKNSIFIHCSHVWQLEIDGKSIAFAGLTQCGLFGNGPELWMLATNELRPIHARHLKGLKNMLKTPQYPPNISTRAAKSFKRGNSFLKFLAFKQMRVTCDYTYYKVT